MNGVSFVYHKSTHDCITCLLSFVAVLLCDCCLWRSFPVWITPIWRISIRLTLKWIWHRCAWESLVLGHNRFCEMGVRTIRNVAIERLRLAAEQLPDRNEPVRSRTLSHVSTKAPLCCLNH